MIINKRAAIRIIYGKNASLRLSFITSMRRGNSNRYIFFESKTKKNYELIVPDKGRNCAWNEIPANKRTKTRSQ